MSNESITSPVGRIKYFALRHKVKRKPTDTENTVYTVRLEFDDSAANRSFKEQIQAVNPNSVVTHSDAPGVFTVGASTRFEVRTLDTTGNLITQSDMPVFTKGSTGTAIFRLKPYTGNKLGGSLNLEGVAIMSLDIAEGGDSSSAETIESRLRAAQESSGN